MQPTQQQAIPYQFFQGELTIGENAITWPDQYEGFITDMEIFVNAAVNTAAAVLQDGSGAPYCAVRATDDLFDGNAAGQWQGGQVLPSGSELQVLATAADVFVSITGWLLSPPGSAILAE